MRSFLDISDYLAGFCLSVTVFRYLLRFHNNVANKSVLVQARIRKNHYSYEHECMLTTDSNQTTSENTL